MHATRTSKSSSPRNPTACRTSAPVAAASGSDSSSCNHTCQMAAAAVAAPSSDSSSSHHMRRMSAKAVAALSSDSSSRNCTRGPEMEPDHLTHGYPCEQCCSKLPMNPYEDLLEASLSRVQPRGLPSHHCQRRRLSTGRSGLCRVLLAPLMDCTSTQ